VLDAAGLETIVTDATRLGMGHSIARGASHILERCGERPVVVALGDMPRVQPETFRALIAQLCNDPLAIIAPSYRNRRGHPVVFGKAHLAALAGLSGDRGAFAILERTPPRMIEVDDPGVLQDIDTPEDLAADAAHGSMDRRRDTSDSHRD
jgi:molybdenum cofactor cytidylyltransferase